MSGARWLIALVVAAFGFISYCSTTSENPITGEKQHVRMTAEQEVALGRQLAPQMAAQMGGVSRSPAATERVRRIGQRIVERSSASKTPYKYDFYLLADRRTVNAFALPGGQVFITEALLGLLNSEDEIGAVLGHEVGHVLARHSAEQLAKQQLTQNIIGAVVIGSGSYDAGQLASLAGSMINMKYGRDDELEADSLGLRLMREAGYDPRAMINVMQVLEKASGGARQPEFASTHPSPGNRIQRIKEQLAKMQQQQ
jgi:beta-barrel assembly-enhancing protease